MPDQQQIVIICVLFLYFFSNILAIETQKQIIFACIYALHQQQARALALQHERLRRRRVCRRLPFYWCLPRPRCSWFEIHLNDIEIPEDYFKTQLRLSRNTFRLLLDDLIISLSRQNTQFRDCIPPAKVLAIGLYRLAHGGSYITIGPVFNVGKSTVIECVQDVIQALNELSGRYIKFPDTQEEVLSCIRGFEAISDLPNIVGAIDGTHIKIKAPKDGAIEYFSRYQQHDFIIQGVVDADNVFRDISVGFPGSMHDGRVLRNTTLYNRAERNEILRNPVIPVGDRLIGPYLVGDSAYPLCSWIQKPFPEATNDPSEKHFNQQLSKARVVVECAFGILKSRWRILQKRLDSSIGFSCQAAVACIVLHNFCISVGDEWEEENDCQEPREEDLNNFHDQDQDGDEIRQTLVEYLQL